MKPTKPQETDAPSLKWGYSIAGAFAIGFAALIQIAFDGLDEETLAGLPAIVTVPYGIAGKLGITVPLALLGGGLILRDVLVNRLGKSHGIPATQETQTRRPGQAHPKSGVYQGSGEDLEVGEPLAEELPPSPSRKPARKIAALAGGFGGRRDGASEMTSGALGDAPVAPRPGSGQVLLSSAKYLNRNPGGSFRRGTTQHSTDE